MIGTSYYVNATWTQIPTGPGFVQASAIAYGGRSGGLDNPDVLYVSSGSQIFLRTIAGGTLTVTAALPAGAGNIATIALDPNNWKTAFVTDATNVYMTTDAGAHWSTITGNLTNPSGARGTPAFMSVVAGTGVDALLFGGTTGVFRMLTTARTSGPNMAWACPMPTPGAWSTTRPMTCWLTPLRPRGI